MLICHVVDQLLDQYGLAYAGTAEQTDLAALQIGGNQVDDLDAGFQHLAGCGLLLIAGGFPVDRPMLLHLGGRLIIHRLTQQIEYPAQGLSAHRHPDGTAGIHCIRAPHQTVGGAHGNAAHHIVTDMLGNLQHQPSAVIVHFDGVQQLGQMLRCKADVHHRTDDLHDFSDILHTLWL